MRDTKKSTLGPATGLLLVSAGRCPKELRRRGGGRPGAQALSKLVSSLAPTQVSFRGADGAGKFHCGTIVGNEPYLNEKLSSSTHALRRCFTMHCGGTCFFGNLMIHRMRIRTDEREAAHRNYQPRFHHSIFKYHI